VTAASNGATISGATVVLSGGSTSMTTTTDAHGNYSFSGLPGALTGGGPSYTITVSAGGYTTASATDTPAAGASDTVNFALT
jgi:hypothetical protein